MAAKKTGKKAAKKGGKKGGKKGDKKCTAEAICKYLEKLDDWHAKLIADYTLVRIALCNVEKKAWGEAGATLPKRFCAGGPNDPAAPVKPPVWT